VIQSDGGMRDMGSLGSHAWFIWNID